MRRALLAACAAAYAAICVPASGSGGSIATVPGAAGFDEPASAVPVPAWVTGGGYYVADTRNDAVRRITASGEVTNVATSPYSLDDPGSVSVDAFGRLLIADSKHHRILRVQSGGGVVAVAGTGSPGFSGDSGPAAAAQLDEPSAVFGTLDGGLLIADAKNHRVRRVSVAGTITTLAGNGSDAVLKLPAGLSSDPSRGLLVADRGNHRIVHVAEDPGATPTPVVTGLNEPSGVAWLPGGGFVIADSKHHLIRAVSATATISDLAGTGVPGFSGDGGAAIDARLDEPRGVAVTPDGGVLIADSGNGRIRLVSAPGIPTTGEEEPPPGEEFAEDDEAGPEEEEDDSTGDERLEDRAPHRSLPAAGAPVAGRTVRTARESGVVYVRLPKTRRSVLLNRTSSLPTGTVVDAVGGAVRLTAAGGRPGAPQSAVFSRGTFRIAQKRSRRPLTELSLQGRLECPSSRSARAGTSRGERSRRLLGDGRGRFRTTGRYGAATVRGAKWLIEDRCTGTLVKVSRGSATVQELRSGRSVDVPAGRQHLMRKG